MENYKPQVALLLNVLPEVAKEACFALHGGTAINLFVRNMPRLSVDIDLTYIPLEDRETSFTNINTTLSTIKDRLKAVIPNTEIIHQQEKLKLQIRNSEALIKLEVNQGIRGIISDPVHLELCEKAETAFDVFCMMRCVPLGQLFGGKICAALDRQHPRDLFDVKYLLNNEGITDEIKTGFLFTLLSSKRPIREILFPHLINQHQAFSNQFVGMTEDSFTYEDFERVRQELVGLIHENLMVSDKQFILDFENATPDWGKYDFSTFPAVQWKLQNIKKLQKVNPGKHQDEVLFLQQKLGI